MRPIIASARWRAPSSETAPLSCADTQAVLSLAGHRVMEIEVRRKVGNLRRSARSSMRAAWRGVSEWLDHPVVFASCLVVIAVVMLTFLRIWYDGWDELGQGVFVEATGATMDVAVFGILIALVAARRERNREIGTQEDLIDDFKKWDSEEARYRIAGSVRRLNRLGRTSIDFAGIKISDFSFRSHDINSIAGSRFYDGTVGGSSGKSVLKNVEFSLVDCRDVVFSAFNPSDWLGLPHRSTIFRDCWFGGARLEGATFRGARIEWSDEPPEEAGHWDRTQDGDPVFIPSYCPPFGSADLAGVSFEDVAFRNADFREATNLRMCKFAGSTGLEEALFDSDEDKEWALLSARTMMVS